jgi:hypothetical protein
VEGTLVSSRRSNSGSTTSDRRSSAGATIFAASHDGAVTWPATDATAYSHRDESYRLLIETRWSDPATDEDHIAWTRSFHNAIQPYTTGDLPPNFLTTDESNERVNAAYGQNYERLIKMKNEWNPENLFRMDPNIEPTE